jgi:tRNA A-37 threonylcarbamoyl transferase component Bud32/tetratricopeptide (TPR) repeat protein
MHGHEDIQRNTVSGSLRDADNGQRPPANDQLVGTIFAEKYRMLSVLGEGGMSVVYKAEHLGLKKVMAIKVLHTHLSGRSNAQGRFRQEAQSASSLSHPGVIGMHDYGVTEDGTPYLVMDFVDGESLAELLETEGYLAPERALEIFGETCAAIAEAHEHGVVHRDLKPSNIMLARDHNGETHVKVVDFGVAKVLGEPSQSNPGKLTQTGDFVGSPFYMSPEQCSGKPLDARSDIYSMGCVMYEVLTGQVAFAADSIYGTMFKHLNEMPPSLTSARPQLAKHTSLEKIVLKALAKDPNKRYQSMRELLVDISAIQEGQKTGLFAWLKEKYEVLTLKGQAVKLGIICGAIGLIVGLFSALVVSPRLVLSANNACAPESVTMGAIIYPKFPPPREIIETSDPGKEITADQQERLGTDDSKNYINDPAAFGQRCQVAGTYLTRRGRYKQAVPWWLKSLQAFGHCSKNMPCIEESDNEVRKKASYSSLAECYYRLDQYPQAVDCYEKRQEIDRKLFLERDWLFDPAIYARASICEDYHKALKCFNEKLVLAELSNYDKAFSRQPISADQKAIVFAVYFSEIADMARNAKQYRAAELAYQKAIRFWKPHDPREPGGIYARFGLAACLLADHLPDDALVVYNQTWDVVKDMKPEEVAKNEIIVTGLEQYSNLLLQHSNLLLNRDNFFKAIAVYQKSKAIRAAQPL